MWTVGGPHDDAGGGRGKYTIIIAESESPKPMPLHLHADDDPSLWSSPLVGPSGGCWEITYACEDTHMRI